MFSKATTSIYATTTETKSQLSQSSIYAQGCTYKYEYYTELLRHHASILVQVN